MSSFFFFGWNYTSHLHMEANNCTILVTDFTKFRLPSFLFKESLV